MVDLQWHIINVALSLILILNLHLTLSEAKKRTQECPIGFEIAFTKSKEKVCYSLKRNPETFMDKFDGCTGNIFTFKLYNSLSLPKSNLTIWTDYKYGVPFIDWSYTNSTGETLETKYDVKLDPSLSVNDNLCVVIDPVNKFIAVRCSDLHHRYCFIKTYTSEDSTSSCEELTDGTRFLSPMQTCLSTLAGVGGLRATWNQSQALCEKRGGSVLGRGWRYSNYFKLPSSGGSASELPMYPLNFVFNPNHTMLRFGVNDSSEIPSTEWHFERGMLTKDTSFGAINNNDFWDLVNSSYVFFNVICERPIELRHVNLTVSVNSGDGLITLTVKDNNETSGSDTILFDDDDDIMCFTDSSRCFPQKVNANPHTSIDNVYIIKPMSDGYYWCTHKDSKNFYISESNRALYVKVKESTENLYAVKIRTFENYTLDRISNILEHVWKRKIKEYVFYSTKYNETYDPDIKGSDPYVHDTIMKFRKERPGLEMGEREVIRDFKLKKLYLDARTALLHVVLYPEMKPVKPGQWENIEIEYMKPAYYCDKEKKLGLGMTHQAADCKLYTCVGDYNDGVEWIESMEKRCNETTPPDNLKTTTTVDVTNVTTSVPTTTPVTPALPVRLYTCLYNGSPRERNGSSSSEELIPCTETPGLTTVTETSYEVSTASNEVWTVDTSLRPPKPPTVRPPPPTTTETPTEAPATTETTTMPTTQQPTTPPPPPTRPPPTQQLEQVITEIEGLLNNTDPIMEQDISNTFTQVDLLLLEEKKVEIPGNLLHLLDALGARIDLNGSDNSSTIRDNIALLVADAQPDLPVSGLRVALNDFEIFTNDTFEIMREDNNDNQLSSEEYEMVVSLPHSVSSSTRRVSFLAFRNDRAFQSGEGTFTVNSMVLSVKVENVTTFTNGEVIEIHLKPTKDFTERNESRACAYWKFSENDTGDWSQDGCTLIRTADGLLDTCRCDHLTHFAEILVSRTVFSESNEAALEIISIIGCCLSIFGILLVGLTALLFRSWRRDFSNKIWIQLCISIFLLSVCFLVIVFAHFEEDDFLCMLVGVALHYTVLASFCWMLVAAGLSYRKLVTVFNRDTSHRLLKASAFSWGVPCAVVGILLSIAPHSYAGQYEEKSPSGAFCYPSGLALWLGVYTPIAVMLFINWTLFVLIVRSVFCSRRIDSHGPRRGDNEALRCASVSCFLVFLFGLPWIFGLFSSNVVCAYFFTILVAFQGFFLFLFFVMGNKKTRDLWMNKLKIKQTRKIPVTSSTYTNNRSAGAKASGGQVRVHQTPVSIETNASRPRSLKSSDNSSFS